MSEITIGFAFVGVLLVSFGLIMSISCLLSFAFSNDGDERAFFRWVFVGAFFALSLALWFMKSVNGG